MTTNGLAERVQTWGAEPAERPAARVRQRVRCFEDESAPRVAAAVNEFLAGVPARDVARVGDVLMATDPVTERPWWFCTVVVTEGRS